MQENQQKGIDSNETLAISSINRLKSLRSQGSLTKKNAFELYDSTISFLKKQSAFYRGDPSAQITIYTDEFKQATNLHPVYGRWLFQLQKNQRSIAKGIMIPLVSAVLLGSLIVASLPLFIPMAVTSSLTILACGMMASAVGGWLAIMSSLLIKELPDADEVSDRCITPL